MGEPAARSELRICEPCYRDQCEMCTRGPCLCACQDSGEDRDG